MGKFILEHKDILLLGLGAIIGVILPKAKTHLLGRKVGQKIPKKIAIMIADQIDAFEQGLRNKEYQGNKDIVSNQQIGQSTHKLKVDLGLDQKLNGGGVR